MVSRQETARALLTPGEVMQLPATDELVLVSGVAPIRAQKLRYYEDATFAARVLPPPVLNDGVYADRPARRRDDWAGLARGTDARLLANAEEGAAEENGGLEQQRHPGLPDEAPVMQPEPVASDPLGLDEDGVDAATDARVMDQARALSVARATFGIDEGGDRPTDMLPGF
jgi:type IV secretion system protein VirD4